MVALDTEQTACLIKTTEKSRDLQTRLWGGNVPESPQKGNEQGGESDISGKIKSNSNAHKERNCTKLSRNSAKACTKPSRNYREIFAYWRRNHRTPTGPCSR